MRSWELLFSAFNAEGRLTDRVWPLNRGHYHKMPLIFSPLKHFLLPEDEEKVPFPFPGYFPVNETLNTISSNCGKIPPALGMEQNSPLPLPEPMQPEQMGTRLKKNHSDPCYIYRYVGNMDVFLPPQIQSLTCSVWWKSFCEQEEHCFPQDTSQLQRMVYKCKQQVWYTLHGTTNSGPSRIQWAVDLLTVELLLIHTLIVCGSFRRGLMDQAHSWSLWKVKISQCDC